MKPLGPLEKNLIFVEIRPTSFHASTGSAGVDLALERSADGRLTPDSAAAATAGLQGLLQGSPWRSRARVFAAIGSRGVLLRPMSLPASAPREVAGLLQLKIEGEFPLPPEALAWGWSPLRVPATTGSGPARQEMLVAAVKKEVIEEYLALLAPVDPDPIFTLAALARAASVPLDQRAFAILDIGLVHSELTVVEDGNPPSVQLLPWGENRLRDSLAGRLSQDRDEAAAAWATLLARPRPASADAPEAALKEVIQALGSALPAAAQDRPLWISGPPGLPQVLVACWKGSQPTRAIPVSVHPGHTAATAGLEKSLAPAAGGSPPPLLSLRIKQAEGPGPSTRSFPRRQVALAAGLLLLVLLFPYLEALFLQPRLARRVATMKAGNTNFAIIDRELAFLRHLELNQAPHLDAAFVVAQAAPQGARINTLSVNRNGEIALNGFLQNLTQVGDFRLKLIQSGFFSSIVVEDQTPTPDRQRINFRITGRWKPAAEREVLNLGPVLPESNPGKPPTKNSPLAPPPAGVTNRPTGTNAAPATNKPVTL